MIAFLMSRFLAGAGAGASYGRTVEGRAVAAKTAPPAFKKSRRVNGVVINNFCFR